MPKLVALRNDQVNGLSPRLGVPIQTRAVGFDRLSLSVREEYLPRPEVGSHSVLRLKLLGVGAMNSPRYAPAGLLVEYGEVSSYERSGLRVEPRSVVHTSHPRFGYLITTHGRSVAWAPECLEFPAWATGVDLMFADAAGWRRQIRFAHRAGGHAAVLDLAPDAQQLGVRRLVFAHIGRPTIRAMDRGERPSFGEFGHAGQTYAPWNSDMQQVVEGAVSVQSIYCFG